MILPRDLAESVLVWAVTVILHSFAKSYFYFLAWLKSPVSLHSLVVS